MDVAAYNRRAWDQQVEQGNRWTRPVSSEVIRAARTGDWNVVLTPEKPVPADWFPDLSGLKVLCLACGGGQQAPILAAAGGDITVLDNSPGQLEQDQKVARRDDLKIQSELGDMRDLSRFSDGSFDLIFNPCSVSFIPDVDPVFQEAARVLRTGGTLLAGFVNPVRFVFDDDKLEQGELVVRHVLPYSDSTHLTEEEQRKLESQGEPLMFSHSLDSLIQGQLRAGFSLIDFFEDGSRGDPVCRYLPAYFATLARK